MVGGKDHTTHHLVYAGYSDKMVWIVFLLLSIGAIICTLISILGAKAGNPWIAASLIIYPLTVFFFLYRNTIRYKAPEKKN